MIHYHYIEVEAVKVGGEAKDASSRQLVGEAEGATVTTTMIEVQPGGNTLSYTHHGEHTVYILEGTGIIDEENGVSPLNPGLFIFIKPNERYMFKNTGNRLLRFLLIEPILHNDEKNIKV